MFIYQLIALIKNMLQNIVQYQILLSLDFEQHLLFYT